MQIKYMLDIGAYAPKKAHEADAGFDIRTPFAVTVKPNNYAVIDTGVHVAIPQGYVGFIKSKSGLNVKSNIVGEGVIDSGYTGSIRVKLNNFNADREITFDIGDKITQLVILPIPEVEMVEADVLDDTERGDNGFGSTGK